MNPGCPGGFIEPDYKMCRDFVYNKIFPSMRDFITGESVRDSLIYLKDGGSIRWFSGHNLDKLEQYDLAWLAGDEVGLMKGELVLKAAGRLRGGPAPFASFVGVAHYGWLKDKFEGKNDKFHKILHMSTMDNPYTSKIFKENLLANCPARLRPMYVDGQFVPPGGAVYAEFDESIHVVDWQFRTDLQTGCAVDFSPFHPCVLYVQMLPKGFQLGNRKLVNGGMIIFDELHPDGSSFGGLTTERLGMLAKSKNYPLHFCCPDPAGKGTQATSGTNEIAILSQILNTRMVFTTNPKLRLIENGIEHVQRMLAPLVGEPMLFFSSQLLNNHDPKAVLNAIRAYAYPKSKDGKPMDTEPVKDGISDDPMDCVRYLAINFFPVVRLQARVRSIA